MNVGSQVGDGGPLALCLRTGPSTRTSVTSSIPLTERQWSGAASAAWSGSTTRSRSSPAPPDPGVNFQGKGVSILSGSSEPLQPSIAYANLKRVTFQSSAARRSRCNFRSHLSPLPETADWFQSSAARRSRCNRTATACAEGLSEFQSSAARRSRCNRPRPRAAGSPCRRFNPQRLVGAAATECLADRDGEGNLFQSSAARRSRCNGAGRFKTVGTSFNPQRLVGAAATGRTRGTVQPPERVSILSGSSEPLQLGRSGPWLDQFWGFNPQRLVGAAATAPR